MPWNIKAVSRGIGSLVPYKTCPYLMQFIVIVDNEIVKKIIVLGIRLLRFISNISFSSISLLYFPNLSVYLSVVMLISLSPLKSFLDVS